MKRKIYVVGGCNGYANWMQGELVNSIEDCDLVVFTGGEDVDPSMYGEPMGFRTYSNLSRDKYEEKYFKLACALSKKIAGICRGSQFLSVMNGGKLVQHQSNPNYIHPIKTYDGKILNISSTHHQAQYPYNLSTDKYSILGWTDNLCGFHLDGNEEELSPPKECEIVFYPPNCLGIQGHPESLFDNKEYDDTIIWLQNLLNQFMNDTILI